MRLDAQFRALRNGVLATDLHSSAHFIETAVPPKVYRESDSIINAARAGNKNTSIGKGEKRRDSDAEENYAAERLS